jgi:hypothetical protein
MEALIYILDLYFMTLNYVRLSLSSVRAASTASLIDLEIVPSSADLLRPPQEAKYVEGWPNTTSALGWLEQI